MGSAKREIVNLQSTDLQHWSNKIQLTTAEVPISNESNL